MVTCSPQHAAQLGLDTRYARQGLGLLSHPQIDPCLSGVLIVRATNLTPRRSTLTYEAPFLTVQFARSAEPVAEALCRLTPRTDWARAGGYRGTDSSGQPQPRWHGQVSLDSRVPVGELKTAVKWMAWAVPIIVAIGWLSWAW